MEKSLPAIPAKRYFTIGEVSDLCGVKPYVLRYWEQEFTQLKPMKRRGNRRYYQHHEVLLIRRIRDLLYEQGFTINGARNRLSDSVSVAANCRPISTPLDESHNLDEIQTMSRPACRHTAWPEHRALDCRRIRIELLALRSPVDPREARRPAAILRSLRRGVAQPGSALAWGARGREFESRHPDQ